MGFVFNYSADSSVASGAAVSSVASVPSAGTAFGFISSIIFYLKLKCASRDVFKLACK